MHDRYTVAARWGAREITTNISPGDYYARQLIQQLSAIWFDQTQQIHQTGHKIVPARAIRNLGKFLTKPSDKTLSLEQEERFLERIREWETNLQMAHSPESTIPISNVQALARVLRIHNEYSGTPYPQIMRWTESPTFTNRIKARPLDEFSNKERILLINACREEVRIGEKRLRTGFNLMESGSDPREGGWANVTNFMWAAVNLPWQDLLHSKSGYLFPQHFNSALVAQKGFTRDEWPSKTNAAFSLLAPTKSHIAALKILILFQTGWTPDEINALSTGDVEFDDEGVTVNLTKMRANRQRTVRLQSTAREDGKIGWSAGDLLRRSSRSMQYSRKVRPDLEHFWLCFTERLLRKKGATMEVAPWVRHAGANRGDGPIRLMNDLYELELSPPYDLRRIRKTVKSVRGALTGTLGGGAGDDHAIETYRKHYAQTTTINIISAQAVLRAQSVAFERSRGPLFVNTTSEIAEGSPDEAIRVTATSTSTESATGRSLSISACRNPLSAPHNNSLCTDRPRLCLQCSNAVIFKDHLPRLLYYKDYLESLAHSMNPETFANVYGQQMYNLLEIISGFPEEELIAARNSGVKVHVPFFERLEEPHA